MNHMFFNSFGYLPQFITALSTNKYKLSGFRIFRFLCLELFFYKRKSTRMPSHFLQLIENAFSLLWVPYESKPFRQKKRGGNKRRGASKVILGRASMLRVASYKKASYTTSLFLINGSKLSLEKDNTFYSLRNFCKALFKEIIHLYEFKKETETSNSKWMYDSRVIIPFSLQVKKKKEDFFKEGFKSLERLQRDYDAMDDGTILDDEEEIIPETIIESHSKFNRSIKDVKPYTFYERYGILRKSPRYEN